MIVRYLHLARFVASAGEEKVSDVILGHDLLIDVLLLPFTAEPYTLLSQRCEVSQIILLLLLQVSYQ